MQGMWDCTKLLLWQRMAKGACERGAFAIASCYYSVDIICPCKRDWDSLQDQGFVPCSQRAQVVQNCVRHRVTCDTEGTDSEMLPLVPREGKWLGSPRRNHKCFGHLWVPSFLRCQSPYPSSLSTAWKSWCCCSACTGQPIAKMGLSLGWTYQLSEASRAQGILTWLPGIIYCTWNRA